QVQALFLARLCFYWIEFTIQNAFGLLQLVEKVWTNGQQICSRQADDLIHIPKTCPHHLGLVAVFLVVVVDAGDGRNAGILVRGNLRAAMLFLVPIVNTTDERRNQRYPGFGARYGLGEAEEQRQIAVDAFLLKKLSCLNTLPGA